MLKPFSPIAKMTTVHYFLALVASQNWFLETLDINNAFLHSDLDEEVYMVIPSGFAKEGEHKVCFFVEILIWVKTSKPSMVSQAF